MAGRSGRQTNADRVLAHLRHQERPQSAYQILDDFRGDGVTGAMMVYCALDQLRAAGQVHRIESLNAWTVCRDPSHATTPVFEICRDCGAVTEHLDARLSCDIAKLSDRTGLTPDRSVIEIHGRCGDCRPDVPTD